MGKARNIVVSVSSASAWPGGLVFGGDFKIQSVRLLLWQKDVLVVYNFDCPSRVFSDLSCVAL